MLSLALGPIGLAAQGARVRARVLYATVDEAYIDEGTQAGVGPGDTGVVERSGQAVARVEVTDASRASARVRVLGTPAGGVRAGDTVVVEASFREKAALPAGDFVPLLAPPPGTAPTASSEARFHGSIRLRHLAQQDADDRSSYGLSRLELNSGISRVGGSSWSFLVDGNVSYRTGEAFRDSIDYREARYDAYRLALEGPLGGRGFARVGRFAPAELPGFGFVDGLLLQARWGGARWGLLGGARPLGADRRPSGEQPTAGAYVGYASPGTARLRHDGTVAVVADTFKGELDRLALLWDERARWSSRLSAGMSAEADKRVESSTSAPAAQLTRLNVNARWTPGANFSLSAGVDRHENSLTRPSDGDAVVSGRRYLRYWVGAGQYLGAGWRADGDVSYYAATQDRTPSLWRGGLTKTGLPWMRGGYVNANIYNLGGGGLEGLGAQASAGLPFGRALYVAPSVRARNAAPIGATKEWKVLDVSTRADWRADPWTFYAGWTRTSDDAVEATTIEAGVDFRW